MSGYKDKSLDDIKVILSGYLKAFNDHFGQDPDLVDLKLKLDHLANQKKEELFVRQFGDLNAKSLKDCCQVIDKEFIATEDKKFLGIHTYKKKGK